MAVVSSSRYRWVHHHRSPSSAIGKQDFRNRRLHWVQASLEQRQRFQQLFFPDGIAFDGNRFVRTGATAPAFNYLREIRTEKEGLVDLTGVEPVTS